MSYDLLGLLLVGIATLALGTVVAFHPRSPFPPWLVLLAVALRFVGSTVRFDMIRLFYGGLADAQRYFTTGREIAQLFWQLDPRVLDAQFWFGGPRWWGTEFMEKLTGIVVAVIGPSMRGAYLVFSMLAFLGLYLIAVAAYRNRPGPGAVRLAGWLWLWPSLWFWPSSIGKEAVTVLAIGLTVYGYAGKDRRMAWLPFLAGLGLAFALRPHVGGVLALSAAAAYWLRSWKRIGPRRIVELTVAVAVALVLLSGMARQFGLENADLEGVQEFIDYRTTQTLGGGSSIDTPNGLVAIPMAFVNIWMRPFPWDVHNLMAAFSAVEMLFLLGFAWVRRRTLLLALRHWRRDRLLAFALPLLAGYTLMIGLTFANLGIIARQRSPLFPFVFLLLTAAGTYADGRSGRAAAPAAGAHRPPPAPFPRQGEAVRRAPSAAQRHAPPTGR